MQTTKVKVFINLKKDILDPQGNAIAKKLKASGFHDIQAVKQGKVIELEVLADNKVMLEEQVHNMCKQLLVNTVIEDYKFEIL